MQILLQALVQPCTVWLYDHKLLHQTRCSECSTAPLLQHKAVLQTQHTTQPQHTEVCCPLFYPLYTANQTITYEDTRPIEIHLQDTLCQIAVLAFVSR